jgi:predicted nucleic acid-binding protein
LITEDMEHGQQIDALMIIDPFAESPEILGRP